MRTRGWRFNGQQYPNGIHMAVTRPQTQPGVVEAFTADLAEAVPYAVAHKDEKPASGAIYGGIEGGMTDEADDFIRSVMDRHARQAPGPPEMAGNEPCVCDATVGSSQTHHRSGGCGMGALDAFGAIVDRGPRSRASGDCRCRRISSETA